MFALQSVQVRHAKPQRVQIFLFTADSPQAPCTPPHRAEHMVFYLCHFGCQGAVGSCEFMCLCVWLCLQDFRQAAQDFDFGVTATSLVGDDRILQCALSQAQQLYSQRPDQQDDMSPTSAQAGVLLLSNDKVMQLKVGVACAEALWPQPDRPGTLSTLPGQTAAVLARKRQQSN